MPALWPTTLPAFVLEDGYSETLNDQSVESQTDTGNPKIRRRTTKLIQTFDVTIQMTTSQRADFLTFWNTTLAGGTLTFDWVHPLTRAATTFRFRKPPPVFSSVGGTLVRCRFKIETV